MFDQLCTPAVIYLVYSITQVISKMMRGLYTPALIEMIISSIFALFLNYLCSVDLSIVAWVIIFVPFVFMSVVISLLLYLFTRDPETGRILFENAQYEPEKLEATEIDPREIINSLVDSTTNIFSMDNTHDSRTDEEILKENKKKSGVSTNAAATTEQTTNTELSSRNIYKNINANDYSLTFTTRDKKTGKYIKHIQKINDVIVKNNDLFFVANKQVKCVVEEKDDDVKIYFVLNNDISNIKENVVMYEHIDKENHFIIRNKLSTPNTDPNNYTLQLRYDNKEILNKVVEKIEIGNNNERMYIITLDIVIVLKYSEFISQNLYYVGGLRDFDNKYETGLIPFGEFKLSKLST